MGLAGRLGSWGLSPAVGLVWPASWGELSLTRGLWGLGPWSRGPESSPKAEGALGRG